MGDTFKILSIDGGGMKGLFSAKILERIETYVRKDKHDFHFSDYFDLICGTSTGGIIALGLCLNESAQKLSEFYIKDGPRIFPERNRLSNFFRQNLWRGKYSNSQLKKSLKNFFKEKKIKDSNTLLCIPSFNYTLGKPQVFKFDHSEGELSRDYNLSLVDVALSTSAAPTYFPLHLIENKEHFIDGGIWSNNPSLVGFHEAIKYFVGKGKKFDKISILSIPSLTTKMGNHKNIKSERSLINWRKDIIELFFQSQAFFVNYFLSSIDNINEIPVNYVRVPEVQLSEEQIPLIGLDKASDASISLMCSLGDHSGFNCIRNKNITDFFIHKKKYLLQNGELSS